MFRLALPVVGLLSPWPSPPSSRRPSLSIRPRRPSPRLERSAMPPATR